LKDIESDYYFSPFVFTLFSKVLVFHKKISPQVYSLGLRQRDFEDKFFDDKLFQTIEGSIRLNWILQSLFIINVREGGI
jgi:hypothetical protein